MYQTFTQDDYEKASVTLSRGPCFGSCPVYEVTVQGNGRVVFDGEWWVVATGRHESLIAPETAQLLIATLVERNFLNFEESYDYEDCIIEDLATTNITLKIGAVTKTVSRYGNPPTVPRDLSFFATAIDRVSNSIQWVGRPKI